MKVPYKDYKKITSKQQLEDYIKKIENGLLLIYGEPKYKKSPINKEDALIVALDIKGRQIKLKFEYYTTPEGHKYRLKKNNDGTFKKIYATENKGGRYSLRLENGDKKKFPVHHLQLWSYYPRLDWKPFCENLQGNGGNKDASVDHIKQEHTACHYKYLEAVPQSENARRSGLSKDKERKVKEAQSRGKPFIMKLDGEQIGDVFDSGNDAVDYLSKTHKINIDSASISSCLTGKTKTAYNRRLTFEYTKEYLDSQKDLDGEIWRKREEWCQKNAIINRYKHKQNDVPPKEISNKGRIMTNTGKITNGNKVHNENSSRFNGVQVHNLIWEAFSVEVIGDKLLLHDDKHYSNKKDKNGKVIRYSNWIETLRLGTHQENMEDLSRENLRVAKHNPANEFIVRDKERVEVKRSHYVPRCVDELKAQFRGKRFSDSGIRDCLKKRLKTHQGFTFNYVIPRT